MTEVLLRLASQTRPRRKKTASVAASQALNEGGRLPVGTAPSSSPGSGSAATPTSAGNPPRRPRRKKTGSSNILPRTDIMPRTRCQRAGSPLSVASSYFDGVRSEDSRPVFATRREDFAPRDGVVVLVAVAQARHDDTCVARDGVRCCCIS